MERLNGLEPSTFSLVSWGSGSGHRVLLADSGGHEGTDFPGTNQQGGCKSGHVSRARPPHQRECHERLGGLLEKYRRAAWTARRRRRDEIPGRDVRATAHLKPERSTEVRAGCRFGHGWVFGQQGDQHRMPARSGRLAESSECMGYPGGGSRMYWKPGCFAPGRSHHRSPRHGNDPMKHPRFSHVLTLAASAALLFGAVVPAQADVDDAIQIGPGGGVYMGGDDLAPFLTAGNRTFSFNVELEPDGSVSGLALIHI